MKFVGSTHHGQDVPIDLQELVLARGRKRVEIDGEHYCVEAWRTPQGEGAILFLALEGLGHEDIKPLATQMFGATS